MYICLVMIFGGIVDIFIVGGVFDIISWFVVGLQLIELVISCIVFEILDKVVEIDVRDCDNFFKEVCNLEFFCFDLFSFVLFDKLDCGNLVLW